MNALSTLSVQIRPPLPSELPAIRTLLANNGWSHRLGDLAWFVRLLAASRSLVAVDGEDVVGFARAITDGLSNGYLSMVVAAPDHRKKGIGERLVCEIMGDDAGITWIVRAGRPGARAFFEQVGFRPSADALERSRSR